MDNRIYPRTWVVAVVYKMTDLAVLGQHTATLVACIPALVPSDDCCRLEDNPHDLYAVVEIVEDDWTVAAAERCFGEA